MEDPLKPAPKRRVRGGIVVAIIVLCILVFGFIGRNLGHIEQSQYSETANVATHEGQ
ncbi:hypothetical protein [Novosphingobium terrae]|uniref:hypothetical protein n=1 Tax=Novosphingobium terrae TaxID=2726189 RepID=UPI00198264D1|nr:hypothetical protein [Novosphingobium terrae]